MEEEDGIPTAAYLYQSQTPVGTVDAAFPADPRKIDSENPVDGEVEELVRRQDILDLIEKRLQTWENVRDSISNEKLQEKDAAQAKFNQARKRRKELKQIYEEVQKQE